MGTEVSVASVAYNMTGAEADRPNYLKTVMIRKQFGSGKRSMGELVREGLFSGPTRNLRSFYNWASSSNYDLVGLPTGSLEDADNDDISLSAVAAAITPPGGQTTIVADATLIQAKALYWAERWIADNRQSDLGLAWQASINKAGDLITIIFPGGSPAPLTEVISVTTPTFTSGLWYIYAHYTFSGSPSTQRVFIYGIGGGNATLDALVNSAVSYGSFFPSIPIRVDNTFLSPSFKATTFAQTTAAYKKVMGGASIDTLVTALAANPDIGNIDFAYIIFGVSLNVAENECRKYIYRFFEAMRDVQTGGPTTTQTAKANLITIKGTTPSSEDYNIRLEWRYAKEFSGAGVGRPGAVAGDTWFVKSGTVGTAAYEKIKLYWQTGLYTYTYMEVVGFIHHNYVYGTTEVKTKAFAALDATRESGFIIPLHYDVWRQTPLISRSQMATACVFIVFNCFEVYETPWWDSWFFKIFLVVVIAVASVVLTGGIGTVGLLGSSLALGSALGFSGLTAAIVGSVINALAAMVLTSLLEPMLRQVAGPLAPVILAVLMFAIGSASSSLQSTGTFAINWSALLSADNLLNLTSAVGQGFADKLQQDALDLKQSEFDYLQKAEHEAEKIQQAFLDNIGYGAATIDPLLLVDPVKSPIAESRDTFLTRTLMTGSEIATMSKELLYEFPTYSLKLPDAFT